MTNLYPAKIVGLFKEIKHNAIEYEISSTGERNFQDKYQVFGKYSKQHSPESVAMILSYIQVIACALG